MIPEGKYVYCVIQSRYDRNFCSKGVGGRGDEVTTIGDSDLAMVVSNHPMKKITVKRNDLLAHEKVIEEVMKEFGSVLPIRFGAIAANADEIRSLLERRGHEFKKLLKDMEHLVEMGVKGNWANMKVIYKEIEAENEKISREKKKVRRGNGKNNLQDRETIGKMVRDALQQKKMLEAETVVDALRRSSLDYKLNKTVGDENFMNAAFLIGRGRENEFDNIMNELGDKYNGRMEFSYAGPFPVFNFATIAIHQEEWEK